MDNVLLIIFIIVVLFIIYLSIIIQKYFRDKYEDKEDNSQKDFNKATDECPKNYVDDKWDLELRDGYIKTHIKGMYYQDLSIHDIGYFNGYSIIEKSDQDDLYAIAIYKDSGLHIGYAPKGNKKLYDYILTEGGKIHTYGYIAYSEYDDRFFGECCIESDRNLVKYRNKPYHHA